MTTRQIILAAVAALVAAGSPIPAWSHGAPGGEELGPGDFRIRPVVTLEGHAGLENNLEGQPRHYAIDGLFGAVFEWGLDQGGSFAIEAQIGPALVWGEANISTGGSMWMDMVMLAITTIMRVMSMPLCMTMRMGMAVPIAAPM